MATQPVKRINNTRKNKQKRRGNTRANHHAPTLPPKSINDHITHALYINLDKRTDRRKRIENELSIFEPNKVTRIPGVIHKNPYYGCTSGHIAALKMAREHKWPNVLILEDDAIWANIDKAYPVFEKLINNPYDVIMLGGTYSEYDKNTYRIKLAYTASSYIAHHSYYDTLIQALENGLRSKSSNHIPPDVVFSKLQPKGNWFLVRPALMVQGKSHSNIIGGVVNYRQSFKTKND